MPRYAFYDLQISAEQYKKGYTRKPNKRDTNRFRIRVSRIGYPSKMLSVKIHETTSKEQSAQPHMGAKPQ